MREIETDDQSFIIEMNNYDNNTEKPLVKLYNYDIDTEKPLVAQKIKEETGCK